MICNLDQMTFGPNFHKNQLYLCSTYALYTFLFHFYLHQYGGHNNKVEKFHVFLQSNMFFHPLPKRLFVPLGRHGPSFGVEPPLGGPQALG